MHKQDEAFQHTDACLGQRLLGNLHSEVRNSTQRAIVRRCRLMHEHAKLNNQSSSAALMHTSNARTSTSRGTVTNKRDLGGMLSGSSSESSLSLLHTLLLWLEMPK